MKKDNFVKDFHHKNKIIVLYEFNEFYYESIQEMAESLLKFKVIDEGEKWRLYINGNRLMRTYSKDFTHDEVVADYLGEYEKNLQWENLHIYVQSGKRIPILRSEVEELS